MDNTRIQIEKRHYEHFRRRIRYYSPEILNELCLMIV